MARHLDDPQKDAMDQERVSLELLPQALNGGCAENNSSYASGQQATRGRAAFFPPPPPPISSAKSVLLRKGCGKPRVRQPHQLITDLRLAHRRSSRSGTSRRPTRADADGKSCPRRDELLASACNATTGVARSSLTRASEGTKACSGMCQPSTAQPRSSERRRRGRLRDLSLCAQGFLCVFALSDESCPGCGGLTSI